MANEPASPVIPSVRPSAGLASAQDAADRDLLERFVNSQDEEAFDALMQRHGPMVLGVCRRLLHDAHEAEDAFQATFLVLVYKARSISRPELLAPWLHGVAYRTAARPRHAARRRAREREPAPMQDGDPATEVMWSELRLVLDEELGRVAQKYRAPLVLTYLEGKTTEEVARLLGCPKGTVKSRLARGRDRLRARLVRRGIDLSASALGLVLVEKALPAVVPTAVAAGTLQAAALTVAGQAVAGAIPARVVALTKGVLREMFLSKVKVVAAGLLAMIVAVAIFVAGGQWVLADKPAAAGKPEAKDEEHIQGTWALESYEEGGQKAPEERIKGAKLIIAAEGKITVKNADGKEVEGTLKLDPAKKPKEFSFTNDKGETRVGIYKLQGDTLTVCYDRGGERPTEFASKEGTTVVLQVLKREKK
jgi:RNA polymerase sigma factor (sigma-70 family)